MSIKEQFDKISKNYDEQRKLLLPCFQDFYTLPLTMLDYHGDCPNVLDIGSGTGLFSNFLLKKYPNAKLTLIDLSEQMLSVAMERFNNRENVRYIVADYSEYIHNQKFDIIISALSIHHLPAPKKAELYKSCYELLNPNGVFINADQVLSPFPKVEEMFTQNWRDSVQNSGLSQAEIERAYERVSFDDPSPLSDQLEWLKNAGFSLYDIIYKYYHFCIFYAKK